MLISLSIVVVRRIALVSCSGLQFVNVAFSSLTQLLLDIIITFVE